MIDHKANNTVWLNVITAGKGIFPSDDGIKKLAELSVAARKSGGGEYTDQEIADYLTQKGYCAGDVHRFLTKYRTAIAHCELAK